jgi:hypothetical protein
MRMRTNFFILIIVGIASFLSCTTDFEEINTNPNQADQISDPSLLLANIIRTLGNSNWNNSFDRGAIFADQISSYYVGSFGDLSRDNAGQFSWSYYDVLKDIDLMIAAAEEQEFENYKGIGLVLRAFVFQNLTDNFGPIPYTEAGKAAEGINFPEYDSQEEVYSGILAELELANEILGTSNEVVNKDILYNGNTENWRKFSNGLRLRVLLRQSDRKDPSAAMQEIVSNPAANPLFTSHLDQAALEYLEDSPNQHPAYTGNVSDWSSASGTRFSLTMESILKSMNDPRIAAFALPTSASSNTANPEYFGIPNGVSNTSDFNDGIQNQSLMGLLFAPRQYKPEIVSPNAAQSVFMPYSEVQFILAEAREKGYINIGDSESYYLKGIADQFAYYSSRIPANWVLPTSSQLLPEVDYYTQESVVYTGSQEEKLNKIYKQKWLSLFLVGFEAWSEWRRVEYPAIEAGPDAFGDIPVRYIYPADELRINEDNYNNAVQMLGGNGDVVSTKVWWDVN